MKKVIVPTLCDFYKISHRAMYPQGTQVVYSTWTPRTSRIKGVNHVVHFGVQAFIKEYLMDVFQEHFFDKKKEDVVSEYKRLISATLGDPNPETKHIEDLHDLGYLPLSIKSLNEGTVVPVRTPTMTIENTDPRFFWLTNFIESLASAELWQASTSATLALEYKKLMDKFAKDTNSAGADFTMFQGHDFSMRGMSSLRSAILSGMGHLLSFVGTDTIPAISAAEYYYNADVTKELVGTSVPATEHSIQCAYDDDLVYLRRMLSEVHAYGIVSIVSDGRDFWDVITRVVPTLKPEIMARKGGPVGDKVVIRPDSGDPVLIVCGDPDAKPGTPEYKGAIECLWDTFGGTMSAEGYKVLDPHIGLIYGDAITLPRAKEIMQRLKDKGFASTNVVFGIGSYTYQYNTRDTFGYALKSTLCVIDGEERHIFKDPKTDDGVKKSQKGRVVVYQDPITNEILFRDGLSLMDQPHFKGQSIDLLQEVYRDGKLKRDEQFSDIRRRLKRNAK